MKQERMLRRHAKGSLVMFKDVQHVRCSEESWERTQAEAGIIDSKIFTENGKRMVFLVGQRKAVMVSNLEVLEVARG